MAIGQVQVSTTPMLYRIERTPEKQQITQNFGMLDLDISLVKVNIEATLPKIQIDQTACFEEAGLKGIAAFSEDYVAYAKQAMMASIARISEQGTQLSNIQNGGNPIADQGAYNAFDQFIGDWNIDFIPKSRPKIDTIPGTLDIQVTDGSVENNTEKSRVEHDYTPSRIEGFVSQYNSIKFSYTPTVDVKL